jgi:uncharacterized membrane protein
MERNRKHLVRRAAGAVIPMLAIALPGLLALAALSLDTGLIVFERTRLQATADAAAMAGAQGSPIPPR